MSTRPRRALLTALGVAVLAVAVPRGVAHEGACPAGARGLKCESKDTKKHACECDEKTVKGCAKATSGGWLRIRETIQKLLEAQRKNQRAKIRPNLDKVDKNLDKIKAKVDKLIDKNEGTAECKTAAAELLDEFGVRVEETFDPDSATATTTTTLPGGGSLQGSGSISLFDPGDPNEVVYDVSFTQSVDLFGVYVPGRSITSHLPPGLAGCMIASWTTEGDATPDNYYDCTGTVGAGVHVTGNLRLSPGPVSGMQIFLYGFQSGVRYGPFGLSSTF